MPVAETFKALGDPIRLKIIERLTDGSAHTMTSLSEDLGISRQGARKHIQQLADVRLLSMQSNGRQTDIRLEEKPLLDAQAYIAQLETRWDKRLQALRSFVEDNKRSKTAD
jgi:DNA-binding transcriptional ArsR family regulator